MVTSITRCTFLLVSHPGLRDAAIHAFDFHPNLVDVSVRRGCLLGAVGFEDEGSLCAVGHQADALSNQGRASLCAHDLLQAPSESKAKF